MSDHIRYDAVLRVDGRPDVDIQFPSVKLIKRFLKTEFPSLEFAVVRTIERKNRRRAVYISRDEDGRRVSLTVVSRW